MIIFLDYLFAIFIKPLLAFLMLFSVIFYINPVVPIFVAIIAILGIREMHTKKIKLIATTSLIAFYLVTFILFNAFIDWLLLPDM